MVNKTTERSRKENLLGPKNIQSEDTKTLYHAKDIHREQSRKTYYKLHQLSHFWNIAFVDHYLQPVVKEVPSNIKDTNDFVKNISKLTVPENSILVTMDVKNFIYQHSESWRYNCCR